MKIRFDKSFVKALDKIREPNVLKRIQIAILKAEAANALEEPEGNLPPVSIAIMVLARG